METWIWDNLGCFLGSRFGLCALTGCNWEAWQGMHPEQGRQGTAVLMFPTTGVLYSLDPCVLFTYFFCNKPPAIFKGLCTSAQQVFFRYSRSFIVWKIADLINEKVGLVFFFSRVLLPQFSVCFLKKLFKTSQLCWFFWFQSSKSCTLPRRIIFQRHRSHKVNTLGVEGPQLQQQLLGGSQR